MTHISQKSRLYAIGFFGLFLRQAPVPLQFLHVGNVPGRIDDPFAPVGKREQIIILKSKPFFVLISKEMPDTGLCDTGSYQFFVLFPYHPGSFGHGIEISLPDSTSGRIFKKLFSLLVPESITPIIIHVFHLGGNRKVIKNPFQQAQMFFLILFFQRLYTHLHKEKQGKHNNHSCYTYHINNIFFYETDRSGIIKKT